MLVSRNCAVVACVNSRMVMAVNATRLIDGDMAASYAHAVMAPAVCRKCVEVFFMTSNLENTAKCIT